MKKILFGIWILALLFGSQSVFADGTCGTNVEYTVSGNTISFSRINSGSDAVWAADCVMAFRQNENITVVKVTDTIRAVNSYSENSEWSGIFAACEYIQEMYLSKLDVSGVTDMHGMFNGCRALKKLDTGGWNTSRVTNMSIMFRWCTSLNDPDPGGWDVSGVTDMHGMFEFCTSLNDPDVSRWDTSGVIDMSNLFLGCTALTSLNVSRWNTSRAADMSDLFRGCTALENLDVSRWNTANVKDMSFLFSGLGVLKTLDVSGWDTSNVTDLSNMFSGCSTLKKLDVSRWNTAKAVNMSGVFNSCEALTTLDLSRWNTSAVTDMSGMFGYCRMLPGIDVSGWDTSRVTTMGFMFFACDSLKTLDVSRWDISNVTNMYEMFYGCFLLDSLDVGGWDISNVKDMYRLFGWCRSLSSLDVSGWDTSGITNMNEMFILCESLQSLDLSGWNTSGVTDMTDMFLGCKALKTLDISGWNTSRVTGMESVFEGCEALQILVLGKNSAEKNIFTDLPAYNDTWYYVSPGRDAGDPLPLRTTKTNAALFTAYDFNTMAGAWALEPLDLTVSVRILNTSGTDISGRTLRISSKTIQLKASALPSETEQKFYWKSSAVKTAAVDQNGAVTFKQTGTVTIKAAAVDGSGQYAWVTLTYMPDAPVLEIKDSNVRGKNREFQVVIPWNKELTKVECRLYDDETNEPVSPVPAYRERMDSTGKNRIISYVGDPLVNGKVYRVEIRVWNGTWSNTVSKYGMPIANVYGATVVAGNRTMIINNKHREPCDGTRYMIYDPETGKEIAYRAATRTNTTWTYGELTNGKLYYVVACPYRDYKGQRLWGPNENRIYFIPMGIPGNGAVNFSGTTATVSIGRDPAVDGIRVLYRTVGGKLMNGCEGAGNSCKTANLNKDTAYEFYIMKYKTVNAKKYYSMGILVPYKTTASGLSRPQGNPTVAMSNSGNTVFTIRLAADAGGISVLYREAEGSFQPACEAARNYCSRVLDVKKNYTFLIMQYRVMNGKKVYSPSIIARDFSSGKSIGAERLYTTFEPVEDSAFLGEIAEALGEFYTENELLMVEAMEAMGLGFSVNEFLSLSDSPIAKSMDIEDVAVPAEETSTAYPEFYRLENDNRNASVPSFGNK